jgi:hypothetical protein
MGSWGYVVAGYLITAGALAGYFWSLMARARRARVRSASIAGKNRAVTRS